MPGFDTIWPADSAEFCPHPLAQDIFVCGTYKLEQSQGADLTTAYEQNDKNDAPEDASASKPQTRRGKCLLFRVQDDDQLWVEIFVRRGRLRDILQCSILLHETELPAVLDIKW